MAAEFKNEGDKVHPMKPGHDFSISLTSFLGLKSVAAAWKKYFPKTHSCIYAINGGRGVKTLYIQPSHWVKVKKRYPCVGTSYDYLIGSAWAHQSLENALIRAESAISKKFLIAVRLKEKRRELKAEWKRKRQNPNTWPKN